VPTVLQFLPHNFFLPSGFHPLEFILSGGALHCGTVGIVSHLHHITSTGVGPEKFAENTASPWIFWYPASAFISSILTV
jgi:hypothetical protein